jgi:hypothetical protein
MRGPRNREFCDGLGLFRWRFTDCSASALSVGGPLTPQYAQKDYVQSVYQKRTGSDDNRF